MKKWLKHLRNEKGMTLVELLAVVVILGIVAAIAVPAIGNIIEKSKEDAHVSNALLIINAAKLGDTTSELTWSSDSISLDTLVSEGALDAVPTNPDDKDGGTYNGEESKVTKTVSGKKTAYSIILQNTAKVTIVNATESDLNAGKIITTTP